ncbi:MAG: polyribonucleotide nucleotidyltransferase [Bryobacteraceae bacterium]|nr:polyribonucleotide nucleotidyltransferase [Bryobacteraceae bacterium]
MVHTVEINLQDRKITLETGKIAKQASGAVVVRSGDNVVLVTACTADKPKPNAGFFPLTVDYREYTYAAGRFPGGFIKREGRPSEREILTARFIDRPIRPLFPEGYLIETQIIGMVLSADPDFDPSPLAIIGAAAALAISEIPFPYVLGGIRIGLVNGNMVVNPSYEEARGADLSIVVAGTEDGIVMVEAMGNGVIEEDAVRCIEFGHDCCRKIIGGIKELVGLAGKKKREYTQAVINETLFNEIAGKISTDLADALDTKKNGKVESYTLIDRMKAALVESYPEEQRPTVADYFTRLKERVFRDQLLNHKRRPDHRAFDEVRTVTPEVGLLPRTHGSALFTRGETQALVTATLGTKDDEQRIELLDIAETSKRFMLHYNFPPFSVGEVGFMRGAGRREIGHGSLAERALLPVIPDEKAFPYTLRLVSDILESNGSSSMASVCGGTLALMDAGVPIASPVAGVAMGLVMEGDKYAVLTDIAGAEDHYGDMDFKVAGTRAGITALQMDIKVTNISADIMREALEQARKGRLFILDKMLEAIDSPRKNLSKYAPRIYTLTIPTDKIRELIGPGGKVIRNIVDVTGVKIDVEDDGTVNIYASDEISANRAIQMVGEIAAVAEIGKTYLGKVVRIVDFGAFVEIFPGTDGLLHISEISENRVKNVRDELKEGDQIMVKVLALEGNKIKLSRKAILREQREKLRGTGEPGDDGLPPGSDDPQPTGAGDSTDRPPRSERSNDRGDRPPRRGPRRD